LVLRYRLGDQTKHDLQQDVDEHGTPLGNSLRRAAERQACSLAAWYPAW